MPLIGAVTKVGTRLSHSANWASVQAALAAPSGAPDDCQVPIQDQVGHRDAAGDQFELGFHQGFDPEQFRDKTTSAATLFLLPLGPGARRNRLGAPA